MRSSGALIFLYYTGYDHLELLFKQLLLPGERTCAHGKLANLSSPVLNSCTLNTIFANGF